MFNISRSHHVEKRTRFACERCRQKKTRCPGERPACSSCVRIGQDCVYSRGPGKSSQLDQPSVALSLDFLDAPLIRDQSIGPENSPRKPVILSHEAVELYFKYFHRQPLWLFEREDLSQDEMKCEELALAVLAITDPHAQSQCPYSESLTYMAACRDTIMTKISQGAVQLSTIQSLCLLALANFLSSETQLGWFHLSLTWNLFRCACLDTSNVSNQTAAVLRLSSSIHLLQQMYGLRPSSICPTIGNRHQDRSAAMQSQNPLPGDPNIANSSESPREAIDDVWAVYSREMSSIWGLIRDCISQHLDGHDVPPWAPESDYARIGCMLVALEVYYPNAHRFNSVRIWEKSIEELEDRREYFAPWISFQLAYHNAQCTLNHPFIHSMRLRKHPVQSTPTTFWKTCIEKAWLHSNWISQMIQMLMNKGFEISDSFCVSSAAVACSVNLLFCHAVDKRLRYIAQTNLEVCKSFIQQRGKYWPLCASIQSKVEALVVSTHAVSKSLDGSPMVSIDISLMRGIFGSPFLCSLASEGWGGIFDPSLHPPMEISEGDRILLNVPSLNTSFGDIDFSDAGTTALTSYEDSAVGSTSYASANAPVPLEVQGSNNTAFQTSFDGLSTSINVDLDSHTQSMYGNDLSQPWWSFEM